MANGKRFVKASAREINWTYWSFFNIEISKEDFMSLPTNEAWYVKLTMSAFKDWPNKYWSTHYLTLNEYVKWQKSDWARPVDNYVGWTPVSSSDDDLPF